MKAVDYLHLLADAPRVDSFRQAIEAVVSPGRVVLDLGTGIGTYALFAARAGGRVYAVEANPIISVARQLASDNGLSERITFLEGWGTDLEPPEPADVLVFEDFAPYGCDPTTAAILADLRRRWLKPSAVSIPRSIRLMAAPVCCPGTYRELVPWRDGRPFGLEIGHLTQRVLNNLHPASWSDDALLAGPLEAAKLNLLCDDGLRFSAELTWRAGCDGTLHGVGLWLDLDLAPGIAYSNAPTDRPTSWGQVLAPLTEPVRVRRDEVVRAKLETLGADAPGGDSWWRWRVEAGGRSQELNTFRGTPLSMSMLGRADLASRPKLGRRGEARRAALELMDGRHSLAQIAAHLTAHFPLAFPDATHAYRFLAADLEATLSHAAAESPEPAVAGVGGERP